eukprot:668001-Rhodomonas_salina.1
MPYAPMVMPYAPRAIPHAARCCMEVCTAIAHAPTLMTYAPKVMPYGGTAFHGRELPGTLCSYARATGCPVLTYGYDGTSGTVLTYAYRGSSCGTARAMSTLRKHRSGLDALAGTYPPYLPTPSLPQAQY